MYAEIHDVLIIGAGPAGLAVAARLRESTPSALFTDAEHNRYQWIKKHSGRMSLHSRNVGTAPTPRSPSKGSCTSERNRKQSSRTSNEGIDIKVLDSSGTEWLHTWKANFSALSISHLRSPMFFHPCPRDRDGLLAFAQETGRMDDCIEIPNCVGKSMSKHRRKKKIAKGHGVGTPVGGILQIDERDRKDYYNPSADIFHEYCDEVVGRYCLEDVIEQAQVMSIDFGLAEGFGLNDEDMRGRNVFRIMLSSGVTRFAKVVVLAVGAGGAPAMPRSLSEMEKEGACHSTRLPRQSFLSANVKRKILERKPTSVVVVGGGLTAAQIANKCLQDGVSRVFMLLRSTVKLKPFDVDLQWMAKYKNVEKATFWSADSDEERFEMLRKARNGGSIPPRYVKKLEKHLTLNHLSIHTSTTITHQTWSPSQKTWSIQTHPSIPSLPLAIDYIYYATGVETNINHLPFLSPLREKYPVDVVGGMPCLTNDLMWAKNVPLFVAGRLAGLRIGPDCGNLEGARVGAERIAWGMGEVLEGWGSGGVGGGGEARDMRYEDVVGRNMFDVLEET